MDAVLQYGSPTLFITLSPYEWVFHSPIWMTEEEAISGSIPTKRGANETLHISHILEQVARGLITGCNSSTWESHDYKHVLYAYRSGLPNNVQCCVYRFEYQQRRTIHLHMLVWLRSCTELNLDRFKASVPTDTPENAYFVTRLQQSDQPAPFLNISDTNKATAREMILYHTPSDKALNIRAFIDTILYVLQSRMDVQCSDGKQALMRYVTSYVSKLSENAKLLRTTDSTAFQQVWPFLIDLFPGEPEITMAFADTHISYYNLSRVKLVPPTVEYLEQCAIYKKYVNRSAEVENLSCLQYCREYTISKHVPTVAATENLVGVHYKYIFNPRFFYEYTIVNTPFRNISDLQDPILSCLPKQLQEFSYLYHNHKDFILSHAFREFLAHIGYNDMHIKEYVVVIKGYILLYNKFITNPDSNIALDKNEHNLINLNLEQQVICNHVIREIRQRACNTFTERHEESDDTSDSTDTSDSSSLCSSHSDSDSDFSCNYKIVVPSDIDIDSDDTCQVTPILIKGEPGTGKTYVIEKIVQHCVENELSVLFAYATAYQARETKHMYTSDNVHSDTVHSIFKIPIDGSQGKVNFELMKFDIVIIDEVGMVTKINMNHVISSLKSLPIPPVLLLVGDPSQQQPLGTVDGKTTLVANIFNSSFVHLCHTFKLYQQNRFQCDILRHLLDIMRDTYVSERELSTVNSRCIYEGYCCTENIIHAFNTFPYTTFLTITRQGCRIINDAITSHIFSDSIAIGEVLDADFEPCNLFQGMRIVITQNLNKTHDIVNGQQATILAVQNDILFIRVKSGSEHFLYPRYNREERKFNYAFLTNYAQTIFKGQGKNFKHVTIWLDRDKPSPGAAYVAFSRVRTLTSIQLLERVHRFQLCPIKIITDNDTYTSSSA